MIFFALIFLIVLLGGTWLFFLHAYYQQEKKISSIRQEIIRILRNRLHTLPLLITLMEDFVIKKDDVFYKILRIRKELQQDMLLNEHLEKACSEQLHFLFQIAEKHPDLVQEPRFCYTQNNLLNIQQHIQRLQEEYDQHLLLFSQLKKRSLLFLFPGYFLFPIPHSIHL